MLMRKIYDFPPLKEDNQHDIQEKYLELLQRHRNNHDLDNEELDYFDQANNFLETIGS